MPFKEMSPTGIWTPISSTLQCSNSHPDLFTIVCDLIHLDPMVHDADVVLPKTRKLMKAYTREPLISTLTELHVI